jgi:hypothetical protein
MPPFLCRIFCNDINPMTMKSSFRLLLSAVLLVGAVAGGVGCGSGSSTTKVEGYTSAMLNNRRVALLIPSASSISLSNPEIFAASRGVDVAGAQEALYGEFRTQVIDIFNSRLDSNTVYDYSSLPVSGSVMLDATGDFPQGAPSSWEKLKRAGKDANLDYLIVLNRVTVSNSASSTGGRGDETMNAEYILLDLGRQKVMTSGNVGFTVRDPRTPTNTWERLVDAVTAKLPFSVADGH